MTNFDKILHGWTSPDDLLSNLAAEVKAEALRRIEAPIRAELYAKAGEWLQSDMIRLDADLARLDDEIGALKANQTEAKRRHAELETAFNQARPEHRTQEKGIEVEQARRLVFQVTEKLNHLTHERTETYQRRQETARALAMVSKP